MFLLNIGLGLRVTNQQAFGFLSLQKKDEDLALVYRKKQDKDFTFLQNIPQG